MASQNNYLDGMDIFLRPTVKFFYDYSGTTQKKTAQDEIEQIIYSPPATVVKWNDGDKTVVKTTDKDDYDPIFGFLMAYFQKHSGMTKTQVGKFCDSIIEEFGKQQEKKNKKKKPNVELKTCVQDLTCGKNKNICCFVCDELKDCPCPCELSNCKEFENK